MRTRWPKSSARFASAAAASMCCCTPPVWSAAASCRTSHADPGGPYQAGFSPLSIFLVFLRQRFCRLFDVVRRHLNQRAKAAAAGAEGLHRKDVDFLRRQFGQDFSHRARMVFTGDVECRLLLSELDLELFGGLLELCRVFRHQVDPGLALAHRVAPNADEIHASFLERAEHMLAFSGLVRYHH